MVLSGHKGTNARMAFHEHRHATPVTPARTTRSPAMRICSGYPAWWPAHLLAGEHELNHRPRVMLQDRCPADLFAALLASTGTSVLRR